MPNNNELWINPTSETLRFKVNNKMKTVNSSRYYPAGVTNIARGTALTINTSGKVIPIDTSIYSKCVGIALTAGTNIDDNIEVARFGSIKSLPAASLMSSSYPVIDTIDAGDIGKIVYVSQESGKYTLSVENAVLNNHQIIELGTLVAYDGTYMTLDLAVQGDSRGPVGSTEIEYTLADDIFLQNNLGQLPPKLFCVGQDTNSYTFKESITLKYPSDATVVGPGPTISNLNNQYIIIYNGQQAFGLYFTTAASPTGVIPSSLQTDLDALVPRAYQTISEVNTASTNNFWTDATLVANGYYSPSSGTIMGNFMNVVMLPANNYKLLGSVNSTSALAGTAGPGTDSPTLSGCASYDSVNKRLNFIIQGTSPSPMFIKYSGVSNDLNGFLYTSVNLRRGGNASAGKAILADNGDVTKTNVIGYLANTYSNIRLKANDSGLFQKMGVVTGFSGFTPGASVYLGTNGSTLGSLIGAASKNAVQVGTARSATSVDVNIGSVLETPQLDYPVGAVLKLVSGQVNADTGFVLCDGVTSINKVTDTDYTEVVDYVNKINGTSGNAITVPNLPGYQMKVKRFGGMPKYPSAFTYSVTQTYTQLNSIAAGFDQNGTAYSDSPVKTYLFDYTTQLGSLVDFTSANLSKIVLKFFLKETTSGLMTELVPGIRTVGSTTYGFMVQDGFVNSPRTYAARLKFYTTGGNIVLGYSNTDGTSAYTASGTDQLIIQAYRAENFEYFISPETYKTRTLEADLTAQLASLNAQVYLSKMGGYL